MKRITTLFAFVMVAGLLHSQQYCVPGRFDTSVVFSYAQLHHRFDGVFGIATDWLGQPDTLTYDYFLPRIDIDTFAKVPLIVFIHGGGFWTGDKIVFDYDAIQMAQRGYASASINYRVGWDIGSGPKNCDGNPGQQVEAMYRALQDAHAALRYFVHYADSLHIDTAQIFVAGSSAGAVTSLLLAYMQQDEVDSLIDTMNLHALLGPVDSSSNHFTDRFTLKGIVSLWGGIPDTLLITAADQIPTLMMHGTNDSIVPYIFGSAYYCPNSAQLFGSKSIQQRLESLNENYELDYHPGGGHGVFPKDYRLERISFFLKRILCGECRQIIMEDLNYIQNDSCASQAIFVPGIQHDMTLEIYPNPAHDKLILNLTGPGALIEIFDLSGQLLSTRIKADGINHIELDISDLKPGIYLLSLSNRAGKYTQKILVF